MKSLFYKYLLIFLLVILNGNLSAQTVWGPDQTDYRRSLYRTGSNDVGTLGLSDLNTIFIVGKENTLLRRAVYQWIIPDNEIPNNSTINSVRIYFTYSKDSHSFELPAGLYSISLDIINPNQTQLNQIWDEMNTTALIEQTGVDNVVEIISSNPGNPLNIAVQNALVNDRFTLGVKWSFEAPYVDWRTWSLDNYSLTLRIEFAPPTQTVILDQRLSNNSQVGTLRKWEGTDFTPYPYINPGAQFEFPVNSQQTILGDQTIIENQKYNNWNEDESNVVNHHSFPITPQTSTLISNFDPTNSDITIKNSLEGTTVDGGQVEFRDPWFIDYPDPLFPNPQGGYYIRNRGMNDAIYYQRPSPFYPTTGGEYKGVFLNQPTVSGKPYYKVGMPAEQLITINGQNRKFFPFIWTGTGVSFQEYWQRQTGVVFTSSDATATAVLKGQLMSSDQYGVKYPSQRKMVRTDNGIYHTVYESMGTVWYAHSTTSDFYGAWNPDQTFYLNAKNPSIAYSGNVVKIVFEEYDPQYGGNADIWMLTFTLSNGVYEWSGEELVATYPNTYYGYAKPVISYTTGWEQAGEIFVAYRKNTTEGIKHRTRFYYMGNWGNWTTEADIPGTNGYSSSPAIIGEPGYLHLAYEYLNGIYYKYIWRQGASTWNYGTPTQFLSSRSGFNLNLYPVISLSDNSTNQYVMVSWLGIYDATPTNPIQKTDGTQPLHREAAVVMTGYGESWGTTSNFSDNVDFTNNGSLNTIYGSIMTWSESDGQYSKYVRRRLPTGYDPITPLAQNGIQTLVSNGTEFGNIKAMVFDNLTNAPYMLNWCTNDFTYIPDGMEKLSESGVVDISYGRSGIVEKNGIEFVFNIGDVLLNGETIKFIERADTLPVLNIEELNASLRTDTLNLNPQSELIFSDYYYVVNSGWADSLLNNEFNVNFKCELVKLLTGEVIGEFEEINYNKNNLEDYGYQGYLVDCSGIEAGKYYLRLTSSVNEEVGLSLSDIQMDNVVLEKSKLNIRNFKGETLPIEYSLEQNYPNPFNPTTTIRYQIPKDGLVSLKVYDILGSEVTTLVNEEMVAGKYEVNFNAGSLASGVYIYRLNANDFVNVKKMVLLK